VRFLALTCAFLLLLAASAAAQPVPSFTVTPDPPVAGQPATFTSNSTTTSTPLPTDPLVPSIKLVEWDFVGSDTFEEAGATVTQTFATPGEKAFRMRVTDFSDLQTIRPFTISVAPPPNKPPVAQFSFVPATPVVGQEVLLESFSYDLDGSVATTEWDLDYNGTFNADVTGPKQATKFLTTGTRTIALRVRDNASPRAEDLATKVINIAPAPANKLPVAQFAVAPLEPVVGEQVALRSFSLDPDGSLASQRWDLDGDGDFDENARGPRAFTTFTQAGPRIVRLEVRDSQGAVQTETQTIDVEPARRPAPSLLYPFPVVRLAGSVIAGGARVRTLEVRAPRRARISVRCAGSSCPAKRFKTTAGRRPVRFKRLARFLRAGTVLSVSVTRGSSIGKYTRWRIRGGKLPKRTDRCLWPGRSKPARCPR
jgi:PKD repeat protein